MLSIHEKDRAYCTARAAAKEFNMCNNYPLYMPMIPSFLMILRIACRLVLCSLTAPPSPMTLQRTH